jgi:hypothetical protein
MKKLLSLLSLILISLTSFGQLTISQSLSPNTNLKVGDTITVSYNLTKGQVIKNPRYLWFRYQYNNKALTYVSTAFNQGTSAQTFYTGWNNYKFTFNGGASDNDLDVQYGLTPWNYTVNADWNVGQLTIQRADASISGLLATQKYILKDQNTYNNIFKLDLATGTDTTGANVGTIYGGGWTSLTDVKGNTSQFKVRALYPQGYTITDHTVQLMKLKSDGSGDIDWSQQPIATAPLDASGEALFTTQVKVGDSVGVFIAPAWQKTWMNNIVTVSDAYKAFLGVSQTDISGTANYFTYPSLEKKVGKVTTGNNNPFGESDSYYIFAHVIGQNVDSNAMLPKSTGNSVRWYSGLLNQSWLDGVVKNRVVIDSPSKTVDAVFAWGGDLNWSHSSDPAVIASRISSGNYLNSVNPTEALVIKSMSVTTPMAYITEAVTTAKLSVTSTLENGKVVLTTTLTKEDLAGLQIVMNYDSNKLTLDNVIFDAGSTITNFSTKEEGRLTFGSIDQLKTARIKAGTPYKLIFTPKTPLTNTAGLFYFVLSDAVDSKGNKIDLIVE